MSFFIQYLPLTLPYVEVEGGIVGVMAKAVTLHRSADSGIVISRSFEAKRRRQYAGFQVIPREEGIKVALRDPDGHDWSYHGTWVEGGWSTPDEVRSGLATWMHPVQCVVQLNRLPDGSSPVVTGIKVGFIAYGHVLSYLLNFCLPRIIEQPITLTRWIQQPSDEPIGVNLDRVTSRSTHDFDGNIELMFGYTLRVELIANDDYAIDETPLVILQPLDTTNERQLNEVDSIRVSADEAMSLEAFAVVDQRVNVTVVTQSSADYPDYSEARAIAEQLLVRLNQGCINAPAYGQTFSIYPSKHISSGITPRNVRVGLLPSVSFNITLVNIPIMLDAVPVSVLQQIGQAEFEVIP